MARADMARQLSGAMPRGELREAKGAQAYLPGMRVVHVHGFAVLPVLSLKDRGKSVHQPGLVCGWAFGHSCGRALYKCGNSVVLVVCT